MIIADIGLIIELGLNLVNTDLNIPDTTLMRNSSGSFVYHCNHFYSNDILIGYKEFDELSNLKFYIEGKTAKYGDFTNITVSKHINRLIMYCKSHAYFKNNYYVLNKNGTIIKENKNCGVKYESDKKFECCICLGDHFKGLKLSCNHIFCKKCIKTWLKDNDTCPYCKTSVFEGETI